MILQKCDCTMQIAVHFYLPLTDTLSFMDIDIVTLTHTWFYIFIRL